MREREMKINNTNNLRDLDFHAEHKSRFSKVAFGRKTGKLRLNES